MTETRRILGAIRQLHALMLEEEDRGELIRKACDAFTSILGYYQAWIALVDPGQAGVNDLAASGFGSRFETLERQLRAGRLPDCLNRALRCEDTIRILRPQQACQQCCLSSAYEDRAVLARPIGFRGKLFGAVVVSIPRHLADDPEELTLFEELARDLGFAVHRIHAHQEAELRLQAAVEAAHVGLWDWDLVADRAWYSPEWKRQIGYDDHEITDSSEEWSKRLHPEDAPIAKQRVYDAMHGHSQDFKVEFRFQHRDGSWRWILAHGRAIRDVDGRPVRMLGCHVDITSRREAEEALRRSEQRYREMFEQNRAVKILIDPETGRIVQANSAACEFYGYSRRQMTELHIWDLNMLGEQLTRERMSEARQLDRTVFEFQHRRADGEIRDVQVYTGPLELEGRQLLHSIVVDITEHRRAQAEREHLLMAIEQAGEGIVITDSEGVIQYVNPAFERMTGYSKQEVVGQTPDIISSGEHDDGFYEDLWTRIGRGEDWQGRFVNRRKDGTLYTEESHISPVCDESGRIVSYVAVKRDITEELRLAAERRQLEEQFRQAQKLESIGRLAGGVAHDLNNLLSPILGYGQLLTADLDEADPRRSSADAVVRAAERARDLVRQLLSFSSKQVLEFRVIDLNLVVSGFEQLLRRTIREDIALEVHTAEKPLWIEGDAGQLEQVLMNLAVNAQDAMPGGGKLRIETREGHSGDEHLPAREQIRDVQAAVLSVTDSGMGIDQSVRDHLFEPFFTTKARGKGTGLGLSTVYGIVKQHGGAVEVESTPGEGSAFAVLLPLAEPPDRPEVENTRSRQPRGCGAESILLVEDDASVRELAAGILRRHGYDVHSADGAEQALALLDALPEPPELLLTDVIMPERDGTELAAQVERRSPSTRVLFMSGYTDAVVLPAEIRQSSARFVQKPFTVQQLTETVREALDDPPTSR